MSKVRWRVEKSNHRVFYAPSQVENCLRPEDFRVGLRLAVLDWWTEMDIGAFSAKEAQARQKFRIGKVTKIFGSKEDPLVSIEFFNKTPTCGVTFGINQYYKRCVPVRPVEGKP